MRMEQKKEKSWYTTQKKMAPPQPNFAWYFGLWEM